MKTKWTAGLLCLALAFSAQSTWAQTAKETDKAKQDQEKKEEGPVYKLKKGATLEEAKELLNELKKYRPKDRATARTHSSKMRSALPRIFNAIVKLSDEAMETDTPIYLEAKRYVLNASLRGKMSRVKTAPAAAKELKEFLSSQKNLSPTDARMAMMACYYLSSARGDFDKDFKESVYVSFAAILRKSENKAVAQSAEMIEGIARRATIVGKKIDLTGTTMDGESFNLSELEGKVVLVDFWATWCGPCIAEHPNIEKNYEKYHSKGFEVVGISLDRNRKALENFVEKKETKWIVLHDEGKNDATVKYGVVGIPSMFLLDRDGKVISTSARGAKLTKLLEDMFEDGTKSEDKDDKNN